MTTPIVDFVRNYAARDGGRFHMPGHKGKSFLGCEALDITEIAGADVLYAPSGVIAESEANATALFGTAHTYYSAEGSSLAIKAMLALASRGRQNARILAARNVHKAFVYAAALLDLRVDWLAAEGGHIVTANITAENVRLALESADAPPDAVYVTSPDYLGNLLDIGGIAAVCRDFGVPLLVDNAHGAYLRFLSPSRHPIDLGAAMCADSAHKTLPVLTGGAYLHIAKGFESYTDGARDALSLFASTSPSYLILQSLDLCNRYLADGYAKRLADAVARLDALRAHLSEAGIPYREGEPQKLVLSACPLGYTGEGLAEHLRIRGIEVEFADGEYTVLMVTPENSEEDLTRLWDVLVSLSRRAPIFPPPMPMGEMPDTVISIRAAMLARHTRVPVRAALGKVCGAPTVACPPAVPIVISGERITSESIALFERYGINEVDIVL
ncbi:MAG: amino acid decarboxylase [Clostridia bacterium]|nr:amino acid decarboxylase [Clostridia bacterium]